MVNHDAPMPLYAQIREYIRLNIQNGLYGINEKIPSERQLAEQFGVNRLTVSKAIGDLAREGVLYSLVGKGTYVAPAKIDQTLQSLTSFSQDMVNRGKKASSRVIHVAIEPADEHVARTLSIPPGAQIVVLHRVRLADGLPIALEKSAVIYALCPHILEHHDFSQESLYQVLREEYGIQMTHAHQTIEATIANEDEIRQLEARPGTPILSIARVTYTASNQVVEYVRSAYRGDRYKFYTVLRTLE